MARVLCGRSGEEWESLRFLEEEVLGNESLHSRRFLGRGVAQLLCSVESRIPGNQPCVQGGTETEGERSKRLLSISHVCPPAIASGGTPRRRAASAVYMIR